MGDARSLDYSSRVEQAAQEPAEASTPLKKVKKAFRGSGIEWGLWLGGSGIEFRSLRFAIRTSDIAGPKASESGSTVICPCLW